MANVVERKVPAADGFELAVNVYEAPRPSAVVVIASATGVKRTYYDKYARYLAGAGLTAVTFDYRGIGGSRPRSLRGFRATMTEWGEKDLSGVLDWTSRQWTGLPLLVVGHSVGGQLVGLTRNPGAIAGLLTVAAQSGYWRLWPRPKRYAMMFVWYALIPGLAPLFSYFPSRRIGFGEDLPRGVATEWARWGRHPDYILSGGADRRERYAAYRGEMLAYAIEDDSFAPPPAVEWMTRCYTGAQWRLRPVSRRDVGGAAVGHFGFFREKFREPLWAETLAWLEEHAARGAEAAQPSAGRPAGAAS